MRIIVHIGLPECGSDALQSVMNDKRGQLLQQGVLYSGTLGRKNHTRLYMAVSDPGHVDPLRAARGFGPPSAQERLQRMVAQDLAGEVDRDKPEVLVVSASQLATLPNRSELMRLRGLLAPLSENISILAHVDEQARVLVRHYADAVESGRTAPLSRELASAGAENWRKTALADWGQVAPGLNDMPEIQAMPHWLDYAAVVRLWAEVFGDGNVVLRPYRPELFHGPEVVDEIRGMLGLEGPIGKAKPPAMPALPSTETLARQRALNAIFVKLLATGRVIPRPLWKQLLNGVAVPGDPIRPGRLAALSKRFEADNRALVDAQPALDRTTLKRDRALRPYDEPAPTGGFRATQYAAAFLPRIDSIKRVKPKGAGATAPAKVNGHASASLTPTAERIMSDRAKENFHHLNGGRFAPHNRLGHVNEEELAAAFTEVPVRALPEGRSGNVIVGCMKDEAPYILEWVAYHRMIGVDNFLIYTNGCSDGTDALLDRLQALGVVQHRNNDDWKGNSPQQHALNKSLKEPLIENADWVIHIDVDEFINIRCGNGRLDDFLERVPDATNVAMTWRLFGYNGITRFSDDLVIDQFDMAAPKYCPKPHTAWGFKTMTRNTGAYEKLSCHRPNKLREEHAPKVRWVNGSGQPMSEAYHEKGWRSDLKTIGYDLLQLNHYALRSAESFLIKRQRGRALHVDRAIGLNYWVRMDWSGNRDITIKRNIPRVRAEMARLMQDDEVRHLHAAGIAWHKAKLRELHDTPEFEELYAQALETDLTEMERVAFALALDMEN